MKKLSFYKSFLFAPITVCILVVFLLTNSVNVHASTSVRRLPYDYSWNYIALTEEQLSMMLQQASSYVDITSDNLIIYWYEIGDNSWLWTYCVAVVDDAIIPNGLNYDNIDLATTSMQFSFSESFVGLTNLDNIWGELNQDYAPSQGTFFGSTNTYYSYDIMEGYQHGILYGTVELDGVLYVGTPSGSPNPEVTDPIVPTPILDLPPSPEWPDFPTNPTVENLLTWIGQLIKALGNWLSGFGAWLKQALNIIITNIIDGFKNVIDNFKSLFKPFIDKVVSFINSILDGSLFVTLFVPSPEDVTDLLTDNDEFGIITLFKKLRNKSEDVIMSIIHVNTIKTFYVPPSHYHDLIIGGFNIDFSWFDEYKSWSDTIISGFLILGWLYWFFVNVAHFVRGSSSIANDATHAHDNDIQIRY